ncbi:MAG: hypothetical protein JNJ75_13515 [Cyclobacteriaceae bacterium]|nr:hypothetical protein [Cyclobacteriaceae bacterium]
MSLLNPIRKDILRLCSLVNCLDDLLYVKPFPVISGATLGQHVRHILEFYSCILMNTRGELICYDNRKRDLQIETQRSVALDVAERLMEALESIIIDKKICVQANYMETDQHDIFLTSTLFRELAYALDHSIHHQAIIKIGLCEMPAVLERIGELGVAPATVRYKNLK